MEIKNADQIQKAYLDFVNNFLTIAAFAEHYGISVDQAGALLATGRLIQEATAGLASVMNDGDEPITGDKCHEAILKMNKEESENKKWSSGHYDVNAKNAFSSIMANWGQNYATRLQRVSDFDSILYDMLRLRAKFM